MSNICCIKHGTAYVTTPRCIECDKEVYDMNIEFVLNGSKERKTMLDKLILENKKLKEENEELWDRIDMVSARIAGVLMSPFAEAGINFDKADDKAEKSFGVPGHQRRSERRKKDRDAEDRRKNDKKTS